MDLIGEREARLLFRVTNCFNPQRILQVGAATGVESLAMMEVNSGSRLYLYDSMLDQKPLAMRVLQDKMDRVECYDDIAVAADEFLGDNVNEVSRLALINEPVDEAVLHRLLDARAVLVLRHLNRDKRMASLLDSSLGHMTMGQSYTNGKIALLIPNPKLQREDFLLWL